MTQYALDPTLLDKSRDIFQYVRIEDHSIAEACALFGLSRRTIYWHIHRYTMYVPMPDDYVTKLRERYLKLGERAMVRLDEYVDTDSPDAETLRKIVKDSGIGVERQEFGGSLVVHDTISPDDRFRQIRDVVLRRNPDIDSKSADVDTPPLQISQSETPCMQPSAQAKTDK